MVFMNRDNNTKDIVDYILNEIIRSDVTGGETEKNYEMSKRWKNDLSAYMERTGKTPTADRGRNDCKWYRRSARHHKKLA